MSVGPKAGLDLIAPLLDHPAMRRHHRTHAVRAHLLEMIGDLPGATESYRRAAQLAASVPEQRYLNDRVRRLTGPNQHGRPCVRLTFDRTTGCPANFRRVRARPLPH